MAYGINAPFGLRAVTTIHGGSWTQKLNEYKIYTNAAGTATYGTSLYMGDPVIWGTSFSATPTASHGGIGTIAAYQPTFADGTPSTYSTAPICGIFMGCTYQATTPNTNSFYATWPGGTQVVPGTVITAYVLDDPSVVYDVQVSTSISAAGNVFVGNPVFPNLNPTGGAPFAQAGTFGRNFAVNIGGGGAFQTVNAAYANNPATGSAFQGSAYYLDVDTSTVAGYNNHDYNKNVTTLPLRALAYTSNPQNFVAVQAGSPFVNVLVTINNHVNAAGTNPTVYVA